MEEDEFWESSIDKINELVEVHGAVNDEKLNKKRQRKFKKNTSDIVSDVFIDEVGFL